MASKLQLPRTTNGMHFIWNVSQQVGDDVGCPNLPTDVNLVKILFYEWMRTNPPTWVHSSLREGFNINGQMDIMLAYWIRIFNQQHRSVLSFQQAGIISPARGISFGPDVWAIVKLNRELHNVAPNVWQDLPNNPHVHFDLRNELLGMP